MAGTFQEEVPRWVPPTESGRRELDQRMRRAEEILAERIAINAKKPSGKRQLPEKILVSVSDPEAPLGREKLKTYRPLYTVQHMVAPTSHFILSYSCAAAVTDAGTLIPLIDKTQSLVHGRMRIVLADAAYGTIVDLQACRVRDIELLAPVNANSFTAAKKKSEASARPQFAREAFVWNEAEDAYRCPQGHLLEYLDRSRKQRHSDQQLWEYRYRCDPMHWAAQCLRPGARSRTIKRLDGNELLDAQRQKMAEPATQKRYPLRGQTVERTFGDNKGNRRHQRFHGRGLARAEAGLLVVAQNLLCIERLERNSASTMKMQT